MFSHAGGQASYFNFLKNDQTYNLWPYEYPGHGSKIQEEKYTDFDQACQLIAKDLAKKDLDNLLLFGHSMGAYIAHQVAYILEKEYKKPILAVIVSGQIPPSLHKKSGIENIEKQEFMKYLSELGGMDDEVLSNEEFMEVLLPIIRDDYILLDSYRSDKALAIQTPLYVFVGLEDEELIERDLAEWEAFSKNFGKIYYLQGDHFYLADNRTPLIDAFQNVMEGEKSRMKEVRYAWAPSVGWEILVDGKLRIANFIFKEDFSQLFPAFFEISQKRS